MEHVRQQLGEVVARSRPELSGSEQRRVVSQLIELIEGYDPQVAANPARDHTLRAIAFVVACDPNGNATETIWDGLGLGPLLAQGTNLSAIISSFHSRRLTRFLRGVGRNHPSYDCDLSVLGPAGMVRVFCSGFLVGHDIVVIATTEPLSASIAGELYRLAASKPALLNPVLKELEARETNARQELSTAEEDGTGHKIVPRRRLLELAAHDLRNPISGVLAACQYLVEDAAQLLEPHQLRVFYSIESSTRIALQLIQRLAEISSTRLEAPELDLRPTNLVAVIQQTVLALRWLTDTTQLKIDIDAKEQPDSFPADPARLGEAFHGLIVNAIGRSPSAGRVEIVIAPRPHAATVEIHREYAVPPGHASPPQPGRGIPGSARRNLSDVHAALMMTRTRSILKAHGAKLQVETHGKRDRSWIVTLPMAEHHKTHGR